MFSYKFNLLLISLLGFLCPLVKSQHTVDSLLNVLTESESKAEILNLIAEATIEDSLECKYEICRAGLGTGSYRK